MVERLPAAARGFNVNGKVILCLFLSRIVGEPLGAQGILPLVLRRQTGRHQRCLQLAGIINAHDSSLCAHDHRAQRTADDLLGRKRLGVQSLERLRDLALRIAER